MNLITKFTGRKSAADLASSIAALTTEIEAAERKRPVLLQELDDAVQSGGDLAAAESALSSLDADLARLRIRAASFERGLSVARDREAAEHLATLESDAEALATEHEKLLRSYDKAATATAQAVQKLQENVARFRSVHRRIELAGGTPPGCVLAEHVIAELHLPRSDRRAAAYRTAAPTIDPWVSVLNQELRDVRDAGVRELERLKSTAVELLMEAHAR